MSSDRISKTVRRLRGALRCHGAVFVLALLVAIVYGSHHIFIARILRAEGTAYHPLTFAAHADASVYGIRANAVFSGQLLAGDISDPERAGMPSSLPLLNPMIMGGLGRVLGSMDRAYIASDFLFPPIIFIILYFIAFELTGASAASLVFAAFFIFIPKAALAIPPISRHMLASLIQQVWVDSTGILYFVRFEYPKITFLFWGPALYGALRAIRRRDEQWSTWLAGIAFGCMFYTYLYDWIYFCMAIGVTGAILLVMRQYRACFRLLKILGIGFVLSGAYWYNFFLYHQMPQYPDLALRIGIETGRFFRWASVWKSYMRITVLLAGLWYVMPRSPRTVFAYLAGLLAAYVAAVNLQLIAGFNPHPDHWYRIFLLPVALAMFVLLYWTALRFSSGRMLAYGRITAVVCLVFLFGRSLASQYAYANRDAEFYRVAPAYDAAYFWLASNTPSRSLVASTDILTNNELMLYTPQRPFLLNGLHTTASDHEVWGRFMQTAALFGWPSSTFARRINDHDTLFYLFLNEYGDQSFDGAFRNNEGSQRRIPERIVVQMAAAYEDMQQEKSVPVTKASYILAGPREEAITPFRPLKNMTVAYDAAGVRIYRINKE